MIKIITIEEKTLDRVPSVINETLDWRFLPFKLKKMARDKAYNQSCLDRYDRLNTSAFLAKKINKYSKKFHPNYLHGEIFSPTRTRSLRATLPRVSSQRNSIMRQIIVPENLLFSLCKLPRQSTR